MGRWSNTQRAGTSSAISNLTHGRSAGLLLSLLLCQEIDGAGSCRSGRGRLEQVPDAAGEMALEAADGVAVGLAFGAFACDVGLGLGVATRACDGDAVYGGVDLA